MKNPRIPLLLKRLTIVSVICALLSLILLLSKLSSKRHFLSQESINGTPTMTLIDLHSFHFSLRPNNLSRYSNSSSKTILILIISSPYNFEQRNLIRRTWRSIDSIKNWNLGHIFLLGLPHVLNPSSNELLLQESFYFQDILQGSFIDSYTNLTYKTIMGLTWTHLHLFPDDEQKEEKISFIVKTDDDVFVDPFQVTDLLDSLKFHSRTIVGLANEGIVPIRTPGEKWFVTYEEYPAEVFPKYCIGMGYILSRDLMHPLLQSSQDLSNNHYFPIEDIYTTGILREHLSPNYDITVLSIPEKYTYTDFADFENWMKSVNIKATAFSSIQKLPWYFIHCSGNYTGQFIQLWEYITTHA